jgi:hypothetical protein
MLYRSKVKPKKTLVSSRPVWAFVLSVNVYHLNFKFYQNIAGSIPAYLIHAIAAKHLFNAYRYLYVLNVDANVDDIAAIKKPL